MCLGRTPILWAAYRNNNKILKKLIAHGAEATDTTYAGWNILHYTRDAEIIKQFPSLINKAGCSGKYTIISVKRRNK
jgi:ankyrin repeat protein